METLTAESVGKFSELKQALMKEKEDAEHTRILARHNQARGESGAAKIAVEMERKIKSITEQLREVELQEVTEINAEQIRAKLKREKEMRNHVEPLRNACDGMVESLKKMDALTSELGKEFRNFSQLRGRALTCGQRFGRNFSESMNSWLGDSFSWDRKMWHALYFSGLEGPLKIRTVANNSFAETTLAQSGAGAASTALNCFIEKIERDLENE